MAYATVQDMIDRYGEQEMVRLTTPAGQDLDAVNSATADARLGDASLLIDSYVGKRYAVPMDVAPPVIVQHCCALARYGLYTGEQKSPDEQVRNDRKDAIAWLRDVAAGAVVLELDEIPAGNESYAQACARPAVFGDGGWGGWGGGWS